MANCINAYSEIGKLRKVLLHRPGKEVERLVPNNLLLHSFDDIPFLKIAQKEHDAFADVLRSYNVEVIYFSEVFAGIMANKEVRAKFISDFLLASHVDSIYAREAIHKYLMNKSADEMVENVLCGIKKSEIELKMPTTLSDMIRNESLYYTEPMPALYYTRDDLSCIGNGLTFNSMTNISRQREPLLYKYLYLYDKDLIYPETPIWYDSDIHRIEGGDIFVLSKTVLAIGCSQRTSSRGIEIIAENILKYPNGFEKVLVFEIPKSRAYMHLDTVFTMVDYDKFTIHPEVEGPLNIYEMSLGKAGCLQTSHSADNLQNVLTKALRVDSIQLIRCGGSDDEAAQREQWNDASNTLAIEPGVVITYDRNYVTNELLDKCGIRVIEIPSSELSRGRGGPRCMSMPLDRENINL
jgi:arginine deiminase